MSRSVAFPVVVLFLAGGAGPGGEAVRADDPVLFRRDVLPILAANCFSCHGFDKSGRQAGLRLDTADGAVAVLDSGSRAIVPGKPADSELLRRIASTDDAAVMPPKKTGKSLTPAQRNILSRWIAEGAVYEKHWSFIPPRRVEPPVSKGLAHPIDRFIRSRLEREKFTPSPLADRATRIRRVSLDLIGLPPTPEEVDQFLRDAERDETAAYAALVERLLNSPHYGERWGRWWLDQARYADSNGYSIDAPRQIWKYRDWVIAALNGDMPFDQFTIEQLAGDLLPGSSESQKIATGFHRNTQINQEGGIDREQYRIDSIFDRVATTGTVWLGLSIGCAQCHDHKFDPIEQKEYYRLFAFLNNQEEPTLKVYGADVDLNALNAEWKTADQRVAAFVKQHQDDITRWEESLTDAAKKAVPTAIRTSLAAAANKRAANQWRELYVYGPGKGNVEFETLQKAYLDVDARLNGVPTTMTLRELDKPRKTTLFIKGDFTRPSEEVTPGTPAVLHPFTNTTGHSNRLDLARWIASPENPLTARVVVNRIWQQYFGRGLVETENDFGTQGAPPSHPELLDWLAVELMRKKWSLKELHRLIVTSHTYQQSSNDRPDLATRDRENRLLGRQRRLRLDAELVRDAALRASGLLSTKLGGPPVYPPIPDGAMGLGQVRRVWTVSTGEDRYRRGVYTFVYRATPPPSLTVFDAPDGYSTCTRRTRSNTPLQALTLMNDASFFECATELKKVIEKEGLPNAFRRCTARAPTPEELAILQKLEPLDAARVLLNLDETVTRE